MLLFDRLCPPHNKGNHHFVLFYQGHGMADLTLKIPVLTCLPGFKSILHEMARHTEFRVLLRVAVIPEGENAAYNGDKKEQGHNSLPVFFYEMGKR